MYRNKILFPLFSALLLLVSCSDDTDMEQAVSGQIVFCLSQQTGTQTRSTFSNGSEATQLSYAVYDADGKHLSGLDGTATMTSDSTAQVTISLSKGDTYTVVFWSQSENSPYSVNFDEATVTYDDDVTLMANDDSYDAFFATTTATVTGNATVDVTLTRPFAQMNFGSKDVATYLLNGKTLTSTQVTISGAYNTFNLLSGEATYDGSSAGGTLTFAYADYPKGQAFPYGATTDDEGNTTTSPYAWIGMVYLFTGNSSAVMDATLAWSATTADEDGHNLSATSLPVQRNYRTNIYGSLLTGDQTYEVTLDASFGSSNDVSYVAATVTSEDQITALLNAGYDNYYFVVGGDIELSSSTTLTISDGTEVTFDLNGNDITATSATTRSFNVAAGGTLTLTDSSGDGEVTNTTTGTSYGLFDVYGTITIESGNYTDGGSNNGSLIRARDGSTLIITGGTFSCESETSSSTENNEYYGNRLISASSCKVSITGGTFSVNENGWVGFYLLKCTGLDGGAVEISNATITTYNTQAIECDHTDAEITDCTVTVTAETANSYYSTAISISDGSTVTVNSGTYTAPYAVYIYNSGGTANLKGGTFKGTTNVLKADNDVTNEGTWPDEREQGSYINVSDGYYDGSFSIATGGTYTTSLSITGGYFTEDPSNYVADGYSKGDSDVDGYSYKVSTSTSDEEE